MTSKSIRGHHFHPISEPTHCPTPSHVTRNALGAVFSGSRVAVRPRLKVGKSLVEPIVEGSKVYRDYSSRVASAL